MAIATIIKVNIADKNKLMLFKTIPTVFLTFLLALSAKTKPIIDKIKDIGENIQRNTPPKDMLPKTMDTVRLFSVVLSISSITSVKPCRGCMTRERP